MSEVQGDQAPILEVRDLRVHFPVYGGVLRRRVGTVKAVDGVSFSLRPGETFGLVGESGSGKTTVGRAVLNLLRTLSPDVHLAGDVVYRHEGQEYQLNGLDRRAMRPLRAELQMIFQDPYSSLNPRMTVRQIVERPLQLHTKLTRSERSRRVDEVLRRVGLSDASARRFPHEFSGGQRQRIGIARALSTRPRIVIADEPVSALDVSVQAQVVNLMEELQEEYGLTYLFIAHDLSVVYHLSDTIGVMYLGNVVECGAAGSVYEDPQHPYSRALLSAVPQPNPRGDRSDRIRLEGDIPTPLAKPSGCGFRTRCPIARPECANEVPELLAVRGRDVACPYADTESTVATEP